MSTKQTAASKRPKKKDSDDSAKWRNRIVGHGTVAAAELLANPKNYRIHPDNQKQALTGVLDQVGWVQSIIVNQRSGLVVDGHMRAALAVARGETVPVTYVELDEHEEALILAALDPITTLAVSDAEKFGALYEQLSVEGDALDGLLSTYLADAQSVTLKDPAGESESSGSSSTPGGRKLGKEADQQIKAVLYARDLAVFEGAIKATGELNRGKAIITICREYLERKKGQLDVSTEMPLAAFNPAAD
jgi:hypothetical protein